MKKAEDEAERHGISDAGSQGWTESIDAPSGGSSHICKRVGVVDSAVDVAQRVAGLRRRR